MTIADDCSLCAVADSEWLLTYTGIDPAAEGTREALLTVGNGYLATRGAAPEATADGIHYPATYAAGVYNRLDSGVDGRVRSDESLVNLPNWLPITLRAGDEGPWLAPDTWKVVHHHVALDLRRGLHLRELVVEDPQCRRTRIRQERLVSMDRPHLACLRTAVTPQNWSGTLRVRSLLDGRVRNDNVAEFAALAKDHLAEPLTGHHGDTCWLVTETRQSRIRVAVAARTTVSDDNPGRCEVDSPGRVGHQWTVLVEAGVPMTVDKTAAVFTSRDNAISEPVDAARKELADAPDVPALRAAHMLAWEHLWQLLPLSFDADLRSGEEIGARRAVNVHLFHVAQTLSRHTADLDAGVPARGLHGEGYRGHVFWDELFIFPLLNLRVPELTRALLLYRYRRLPQARRLARLAGAAGALFPWQSGSDGREETPEYFYNPRSRRWMADNSRRQYHVNLAVAYNVWHYYQVTGDIDFLAAYGAELLVEIARFWAAIAEHDPVADRYHLRGVMGPDEFHDGYPDRPGAGVDDNAYIAVMTSWVLARVLDAHEVLGGHHTEDLWLRLGVTDTELRHWDHLSRRLHVPFLSSGLLAQFDGYGDLDELDWDAYRARYGDIGRLDLVLEAENDTTNRYQASKQADVLMLFYLLSADELTEILHRLGHDFDPATIPDTVAHYLARTTHGSTLSRVVHAWVLSRRDRPASWRLLREALDADLADTQNGTTREGIHLGAMAATADILQRCYTGLETRGDTLRLHPRLPDALTQLDFDLRYRGHWLRFHLTHDLVDIHARPGAAAPIIITVDDETHTLHSGTHLRVRQTRPPAENTGQGDRAPADGKGA
ncbi:MAG: family 65 glycosyl hydrolase [Actinophytocola sp.]|uniref:glycoside hydrolase family 65 protein n=1 Tax=Actinophytocola sp. TaxID=1872138 RepID=UPI001322C790|nr:glycosyl hydrolase family 65 protein [Actinophytocola sp.]MPZ79004.1 family 65 glycosyl hydrolase [Actinophytocola sp.]